MTHQAIKTLIDAAGNHAAALQRLANGDADDHGQRVTAAEAARWIALAEAAMAELGKLEKANEQ